MRNGLKQRRLQTSNHCSSSDWVGKLTFAVVYWPYFWRMKLVVCRFRGWVMGRWSPMWLIYRIFCGPRISGCEQTDLNYRSSTLGMHSSSWAADTTILLQPYFFDRNLGMALKLVFGDARDKQYWMEEHMNERMSQLRKRALQEIGRLKKAESGYET